MDMSKDSIIVREAVIKAMNKLRITIEPSLELKKAFENIQMTFQPPKKYIEAMNKLRRATKSLNEFQQIFSAAVKLKEIIEEHERE